MYKTLIFLFALLIAAGTAWGLEDMRIGESITLGTYEQDGNTDNGKEPIEWIVVDQSSSAAMLLSKYALEAMPFNEKGSSEDFAGTNISKWLQTEFAASFTAEEKKDIALIDILSREYLPDEKFLRCTPTKYAVSKGAETDSKTGCCCWWLKDKGAGSGTAAYITGLGRLQQKGIDCTRKGFAVRPFIFLAASAGDMYKLRTSAEARNLAKALSAVEIGGTITLGTYEQDGNTNNGKEPIEWILTGKKGTKAYLISSCILDWQKYHNTASAVSWEESSLRKWLNNDFLKSAFTETEAELINTAEIDASLTVTEEGGASRSLDGGQNTSDKIFLPSIAEAKDIPKYILHSYATRYAENLGASYDANGFTPWLLRSPRNTGTDADYVDGDSCILGDSAEASHRELCGVRPMITVTVEPNKYDLAQAAYDSGDYASAFALFASLGDKDDARSKSSEVFKKLISTNSTGGTISFGSCGGEPIEWYVIKYKDYIQLVSVYGLEARAFASAAASWADSDIRRYLNGAFIKNSFAPAEQDLISSWGIDNGSTAKTEDRIILLSADEAKKIFTSDAARKCCTKKNPDTPMPWWLRTTSKDKASFVSAKGKTDKAAVTEASYLIRPSLYIWLEGTEPDAKSSNKSAIKMPDIGGTVINSIISHVIGGLF